MLNDDDDDDDDDDGMPRKVGTRTAGLLLGRYETSLFRTVTRDWVVVNAVDLDARLVAVMMRTRKMAMLFIVMVE